MLFLIFHYEEAVVDSCLKHSSLKGPAVAGLISLSSNNGESIENKVLEFPCLLPKLTS